MSAYDPADRYARGVGSAPRSFTVARDVTIPRALDQVYVCDGCGAVLRFGQFCSACSPRKATP